LSSQLSTASPSLGERAQLDGLVVEDRRAAAVGPDLALVMSVVFEHSIKSQKLCADWDHLSACAVTLVH
jgi:hypothetical protein